MSTDELNDAETIGASESSGQGEMPIPSSFPTKPEIPDHEILRRIGRGSYGEVWLARNIMGLYCAVKIVYRDTFASEKPYEHEFEGIRKFEPVSRSHESQVDVLHIGRNEREGYFYYVMELADDASSRDDGDETIVPEEYTPQTLSTLSQQGRLPIEACVELALGLCQALQHLHGHGLVHRDIKPSNIIFVNGRPKLADIGLVARADATLSFVGTEGYLPPEGPGKPQADIYSLGKVFYELATGKDRTQFPEPPTLVRRYDDHGPFLEFNEVILKACHYDAGARYSSAEAMHEDLLLLKTGKSLRRSRLIEARLAKLSKAAAAFLVLSSIAVTAYFYQQWQTKEARRLAQENQALASRETEQRIAAENARGAAEEAARLQELQHVNQLLESDEVGRALAILARRLRHHPEDSFAVQRLLSALTYRNFPLPLAYCDHDADGEILAAEISPDNRYLFTSTTEGKLVFWRLATGERVGELRGRDHNPNRHKRFPLPLSFDPEGTRLVHVGGDSTAVRVWSVSDNPSEFLQIANPKAEEACRALFSPDGKRILAVFPDGDLHIWDSTTGELQNIIEGSQHQPSLNLGLPTAQFTLDGSQVILGHGVGRKGEWAETYQVWDSHTGELVSSHYVAGQRGRWSCLRDYVNSPWLPFASANLSGQMEVWNYQNRERLRSHLGHEHPIKDLKTSPDARFFASSGNDQKVRIWAVDGGLSLRHVLHHSGYGKALSFSPNGEVLVSGSENQTFQLWDLRGGKPIGEPVYAGTIDYFRFSPDGTKLVTVAPTRAAIWDVQPGFARSSLTTPQTGGDQPAYIIQTKFSEDGEQLLSGNSKAFHGVNIGQWKLYGSLRPFIGSQVWNPWTGEPMAASVNVKLNSGRVSMTKNGTYAWSNRDNEVAVWDPRDGTPVARIDLGPMTPAEPNLRVSPDGRWLVAIGKTAMAWALDRSELQWEQVEERTPVALVISPASDRALSVYRGGALQIRRIETGETVAEYQNGSIAAQVPDVEGFWLATWSPDGGTFAITNERRAQMFDAETARPLAGSLVHGANITTVEFSPDSQYLVTGSEDQTAKIWDARTGKQIARDLRHNWHVSGTMFSDAGAIFSPDSDFVATGSWDKTARVWDRETGLPITEPLVHHDWVTTLDFHPTGKWLATGCIDGFVRVWELPGGRGPIPDWLLELAEAIGGFQMVEGGNLRRVDSGAGLIEFRRRFRGEPTNPEEGYEAWARWFFGDRSQRAISPSAEITMVEYKSRLARNGNTLTWGDVAAVNESWLQLAPMDPYALASLAFKLVSDHRRGFLPDLRRAQWLGHLATKRAPELPLAWWARGEVLLASKEYRESETMIERALTLDPEFPNAWLTKALLLYEAGAELPAYSAFRRALDQARRLIEEGRAGVAASLEPHLQLAVYASPDGRLNYETLRHWLSYGVDLSRIERRRILGDWVSAWALEMSDDEFSLIRDARATYHSRISKSSMLFEPLSEGHVVAQSGEVSELRIPTEMVGPFLVDWRHPSVKSRSTEAPRLVIRDTQPEHSGAYNVIARGYRGEARVMESARITLQVEKEGWRFGALRLESWSAIDPLNQLVEDTRYPGSAEDVRWIGLTEHHSTEANAVLKVSGWLIPPDTGLYRFFFLSDNDGVLRLGADDTSANLIQLASVSGSKRPRFWEDAGRNADGEIGSKEIFLEAGKARYLEALVSNTIGSGYFGLAWQRPGRVAPRNGSEPISGCYFAFPVTE